MKRPLLVLITLAILLSIAWVWWSTPARVDMATYAPADSIVYVEFNDLRALAAAIEHSEVWQAAAPITQSKSLSQNRVVVTATRAGIGPLPAVIFARAQVALAVIGLNAATEAETLRVKPEVAIIVETHTTKWRTRPAAVAAIKQLADFVYGASMCSERSADADYIECSVSGGERKIVGAVDGTLVVLGNSDNAVNSCLAVKRGQRPSIASDLELMKTRSSLTSEKTLGFGYISPANSAKLFAWATPLVLRRTPIDDQLEQFLAVSAGKILRGVAWTASATERGIEDRFLFSLESGVVSRLEPAFEKAQTDQTFWKVVPQGFESLTIYRNKEPVTAWKSLDSAVSLKLDAVSASVFGALLKASLEVYGISNPKEALPALSPPLLTMQPSRSVDGSILVARVNDKERLIKSLSEKSFKSSETSEILEGLDAQPDPKKEFSAVFADGYVLLGKSEYIVAALEALRSYENKNPTRHGALWKNEDDAAIVTFANDEERVNNFILTLVQLQGRQLSSDDLTNLRETVRHSDYSTTQTRLSAFGIERITHSGFGQFSTFLSLVKPASADR